MGRKYLIFLLADDSLIFSHATIPECQQIISLLEVYEKTTTLKINREKTSLYFSTNTSATTKREIGSLFSKPTPLMKGIMVSL